MNRDPQTCIMSTETKKSLRQTSLPAHRYWESTSRAVALVGASSQIQGILAFVATLQIKHRWSSFSGDSTRAKGAASGTEGEAVAATATLAAYPWVAAAVTASAASAIMAIESERKIFLPYA